ncbi:MAG: hypothetical protein RDV48_19265 [Candidatus Eremiobacteraeota bacterium]|nr:hypothetical protein [Candidatus Eremiobacteraeota bacterium]
MSYTCGETPPSTLRAVLRALTLREGDEFVDLGCGRGQTIFFSRLLFGLKARGYDLVAPFILKARLINCFLRLSDVDFFCQSLTMADLHLARVIYLVSTTFSDELMKEVMEKLREAPAGAYVVSVSRPLEEEFLERFRKEYLLFTWGHAPVYYYTRKGEPGPLPDEGLISAQSRR